MNDPLWGAAFRDAVWHFIDVLPGGAAFASGVSAICLFAGIDVGLLWICFATLTLDIVTRIICIHISGRPMCRKLQQSLPRYIFYLVFVSLGCTAQYTADHALPIHVPFGDLTLSFLIFADLSSIVGHLVYMGVPVPRIVRKMVIGGRRKIEKTVSDAVDTEKDNER